MKKIKTLILSLLVLVALTGCGNMSLGLGNYTFTHVHNLHTNECYEIVKWHDNEMGIEVKTKEYGTLYFSEGSYILVENECPICSKGYLSCNG